MRHLLVAACVVIFGTSAFFRKLAVDRIHPYQLQVVAGLVYAVEVPLWLWLIGRGGAPAWNPAGVAWGAACITTSVLGAVLFGHLLRSAPSAAALAAIVSVNPLVTGLLAWAFLGEALTVRKLAALLVVLAGVALFTCD